MPGRKPTVGGRYGQIYIVFLSDASVLADILCFVQTEKPGG
jgi:hypothetical protein